MLCSFKYTILNTCVLLCNFPILSFPVQTQNLFTTFCQQTIILCSLWLSLHSSIENLIQPRHVENMSSPPEFKINLYKDYKAERTLGKGGEGEGILWTRKDSVPSTGQEFIPLVVVKTVRKPKDSRVSPREVRFLHIMRQHNHPNVIRMFGWCDTRLPSEKAQVLLEYCDQGDLCNIACDFDRQGETVREMLIWEVTISLLSALAFLHEGTIEERANIHGSQSSIAISNRRTFYVTLSQMDLAVTNLPISVFAHFGSLISLTSTRSEQWNGNVLNCLM